MANFQTHITGSTLLGVVYGTVAYTQFDVAPLAILWLLLDCVA